MSAKERRLWLWVWALTLWGVALRVVAIDAESAWMDEIFSMRMARAPLGDLLNGAMVDRGNPLGYYVLLHGWLELFGDSVSNARVLSALTGALAIPLTALLARRLGWTWMVALVGAALVATSPPLVYLGREARVFALATTVVLVHVLMVAALAKGDRWHHWVGYVLSAAALLYLHYFSVFVLIAAGLYLIGVRKRRWPIAVAALAVGALFAPYFGTLQWQMSTGVERSADTWWKHALFMPGFVVVGHTLVWVEQGLAALAAVLAAICALIWGPVAWTLRGRVPWLLVAIGIGSIGMAIIFSLVAPLLLGRYASLVFPLLVLLIALAVQYATRRLLIVVGTALAGLTVASLIGLYQGGFKDDWRTLGERLDARPVYVVPEEATHGVAFYRPELTVQALDARTINAASLRQSLLADRDVWLVLYRYDPRVTASAERALADLPDVEIETVLDSRRLTLLHLRLP